MEWATRHAVRMSGPAVLAALLCLTTAGPVGAQGGTATATVVGKVADNSGGVLPGVTVTLTNLGTNQSRVVATNEEGRYTMAGVPPGPYSLKAELPGFSTFLQQNFTVNVGAVVTIDATLGVSTVEETVTVTGESPIVESARTDLSTLIDKNQIESLPTNSRNYLDFTLLTPASVENTSTTAAGHRPQRGRGASQGRGAARRRLLEHRRVLHVPATEVQPGRHR